MKVTVSASEMNTECLHGRKLMYDYNRYGIGIGYHKRVKLEVCSHMALAKIMFFRKSCSSMFKSLSKSKLDIICKSNSVIQLSPYISWILGNEQQSLGTHQQFNIENNPSIQITCCPIKISQSRIHNPLQP